MNKITCEKCGLTIDVQHKKGDQFSYSLNRKELVQCAAIRDKVAEDGKADIRFLCPDLKKAIEKAEKAGDISRLN